MPVMFQVSVSFLEIADNIQKHNKSNLNFINIPLYKEEARFQTLKSLKSHLPLLSCSNGKCDSNDP